MRLLAEPIGLNITINNKLITINQMETENKTSDRILSILLKEPFGKNTITSLAAALEITRQGLWKAISKLEEEKLILVERITNKKTSTALIQLNWHYPLTEKKLLFIITKESLQYERWIDEFKALKDHSSFLILFGSILHSPKTANDIDLLSIVSKKEDFKAMDENIRRIQITQLKKIHFIDMTEEEFKTELKRPNKAYLDALKKGMVLHGYEQFIQFIKGISS